MTSNYASVLCITGAALALAACGTKPLVISVGSKNTTEQMILGEIFAAQLEKQLQGVKIERKLGMGNTMLLQGSLQSSAIDLYAEDTGTALGMILKETPPLDESIAFGRMQAEYKRLFQMTVLNPLGFHQKFVIVSQATAAPGVKVDNLTAAGASKHAWTLGAAADFISRRDTFTALTSKYRISLRDSPQAMEPAALYEALRDHKIELAAGFSNDAWVDQPGFLALKDDQEIFAPHAVCIIVRNQALTAQPGLQRALEALSGKLTDAIIHKLNQEVDLKHRAASDVAKEFLTSAGL